MLAYLLVMQPHRGSTFGKHEQSLAELFRVRSHEYISPLAEPSVRYGWTCSRKPQLTPRRETRSQYPR